MAIESSAGRGLFLQRLLSSSKISPELLLQPWVCTPLISPEFHLPEDAESLCCLIFIPPSLLPRDRQCWRLRSGDTRDPCGYSFTGLFQTPGAGLILPVSLMLVPYEPFCPGCELQGWAQLAVPLTHHASWRAPGLSRWAHTWEDGRGKRGG